MRAQFLALLAVTAGVTATPATSQSAESYLSIRSGGGQCLPATLSSRNRDRSIRATIKITQRTLSNAGSSTGSYEQLKTVSPGGSVSLGCGFEQLGPPASITTWRSFSIAGAEYP